MTRPATVDEYLAGLPDDRRATLEQLRATIRAAAPEAAEEIAYDMPAYRVGGRFLLSIAAYKQHYSVFPASGAVRDELGDVLAPYLSGRGTIRFPVDEPIPLHLVTRVVEIRRAETTREGR